MPEFKNQFPRRPNTLRHPRADYSDPGVCFLTLCTYERKPLFGKIVDGEMITNQYGAIVWEVWKTLPTSYPQISIDTAIVMPDHFYGIIIIHDVTSGVGEIDSSRKYSSGTQNSRELPLSNEFPIHRGERRKMSIPLVVGYFKMNTAKRINLLRNSSGLQVWQCNYFDRILRDDRDYDALSEYIISNPIRWGLDPD